MDLSHLTFSFSLTDEISSLSDISLYTVFSKSNFTHAQRREKPRKQEDCIHSFVFSLTIIRKKYTFENIKKNKLEKVTIHSLTSIDDVEYCRS